MATRSAKRRDPWPDRVFGFPENEGEAKRLAALLGVESNIVEIHQFPDGESRVKVPAKARFPLVLRSLNQPNAKIVELLLTAGALRGGGSQSVMLVAPYMAYMRQDIAFSPGEAVSQRLIGRMLAAHFDSFVSVDPHLHRTPTLREVFAGAPALAVSGAPAIAAAIGRAGYAESTVVIGPDEESLPWVRAVAEPLGLLWTTAIKRRSGDRSVRVLLPKTPTVRGRPILLVDDLISTGGTIAQTAQLLVEAGSGPIDVYATHALFSRKDHKAILNVGVRRIASCNTVRHVTNTIDIFPEIVAGLESWPSH